jgi:PAS domain S-box-containing protein
MPTMTIIYFIYGLSFFILGFSIFLYPKKGSSFQLTPSLWLIAAFGILHGIDEWVDMFALIRGTEAGVSFRAASLILSGSSFFFLALFGATIAAQRTKRYRVALNAAPYLLSGLWILIVVFSGKPFTIGEIWARYLFGLPGSLLTSYALISQVPELARRQVPEIRRHLKVSASAFLAYGLFAGLIVPQAEFFPASILNYTMFTALTGVPVQVLRALCATVIAYSMVRILAVFDWETKAALRNKEERFRQMSENIHEIFWMATLDFSEMIYISPAYEEIWGQSRESLYKNPKEWMDAVHPEDREQVIGIDKRARGEKFTIQYRIVRPDGTLRWIHDRGFPVRDEAGQVYRFTGIAEDITERKQAEEALLQSEEFLNSIVENIPAMIFVKDAANLRFVRFNRGAEELLGYSREEMLGKDDHDFFPAREADLFIGKDREVLRSNFPVEIPEETIQTRRHGERILHTKKMPILDKKGNPRYLLGISEDITERKLSERKIEKQVKRLAALRDIDLAITSSLDLRISTNVILRELINQLAVDAADILLLNADTQTLTYANARGFRTTALKYTQLRLGEGHAGRAALERRTVRVQNVSSGDDNFSRSPLLSQEGFADYFGVPLISKGQVKGVLEIFHRTLLHPDQEWLDFMEALGAQAAIAVDNAIMFNDVERSNTELILAYESTLEGWSRALDYRDKETEGHSKRVTDVTVTIARAMGLSDDELVNIRRGALLHDIGKLGVPDNILLKPGKLTDEEWVIMKKHPTIAHDLISPIPFLKKSLDIPYCHHEKWNGTGYPRGLKGEEIPLAARIFSVVDVWDALRSDRPYRPAWSKEKAMEYILQESGTGFDPKVVEGFINVVKSETAEGVT